MRIKTVSLPLIMAQSFDDAVNNDIREGWDVKNIHTERGEAGEIFLIAHLERWDQ